MAEWVAVGISVVALFIAGWSVRYSRQSAGAADRSAHSSEDSAQSAREAVRLDKRRYHDEHRPQNLELRGHERRGITDDPAAEEAGFVTLVNPDNTSYSFRLVLVFPGDWRFGDDEGDGLGGRVPARDSIEIQLREPGTPDAVQLELWFDGDCPCGEPDGDLGHWKVLLDVPPYVDVSGTIY